MVTIPQARDLVERVFRDHPDKRFAVRLWDGTEIAWGPERAFTLVFSDAETFQDLFRSGDPARFGEAFVEKRFDIEGDIAAAIRLGRYLRTVELGAMDKMKAAFALGFRKSRHTKDEDAKDVQAHYDLSNEFYRLFLDERMVYSCAYFDTPETPLERAQERKLDLVCKKLRLAPGDRFLDVGCGWGALVLWAAERYGVTAHGITLSKNQYDLATRRVRDAGLEGRVTVELKHYLDLPSDAYDKIASVGMYEHVGISKYPEYFGALRRALVPGGLLLNHGITANRPQDAKTGGEFIYRYVFPGAELDRVSLTATHMEDAGFEVLDLESLRPHYALTLWEWNRRFLAHEAEAAKLVPEQVMRIWKLYLPGCALAFEDATVGVSQILAAKNDTNGRNRAPLTRKDLCL